MKKNYLLVWLFTLTSMVSAQFGNCDFTSIKDALKGNYQESFEEIRGNDGCVNQVLVEIEFPMIPELENKTGYGGYYFEYEVRVTGKKYYPKKSSNKFEYESLLTIPVVPTPTNNGNHKVSVAVGKQIIDNYLRKSLDTDFVHYSIYAEIYLTKFIFNNDPGSEDYYPCWSNDPIMGDSPFGPTMRLNEVNDCLDPNDSWRPDLTIDTGNLMIKDGCNGCNVFYPYSESTYEVFNRSDSDIALKNLTIINSGNSASNSVKVKLYLKYWCEGTGGSKQKQTYTIPALQPNESFSINYLNYNGQNIVPCYGYSQILVKIDPGNDVKEYDEYNNEFEIGFDFKSAYHSDWNQNSEEIGDPLDEDPFGEYLKPNIKVKKVLPEYELKVYDMQGTLILSKWVINGNEKEVLNSLPRGLYIFNSQDDSRKVMITTN